MLSTNQVPTPFLALASLEPHGIFWLCDDDVPAPPFEVAEGFIADLFDKLYDRVGEIYRDNAAVMDHLIGCGVCADPPTLILQFDDDSDGIFSVPPLPPAVGAMLLLYDSGMNLVAAGADMFAGVVVPRNAEDAIVINRDGGRAEHEAALRTYADAVTSGLIAAREELFRLMPGRHDLCVVAGTGLAKDGLTLWKTIGFS